MMLWLGSGKRSVESRETILNRIEVSWIPDDEWLGQLIVEATSDGFTASGSAWFNREDLEAFAARLERYPLPTDPETSLTGGYEGHPTVELAFAQCNPAGTVLVVARLANDDTRTDLKSRTQSAVLRLHTEYASLAEFAARLRSVLRGAEGPATLRCR